nr:LysR substrate-binding domain-containing protein [Aeromonas caviae]
MLCTTDYVECVLIPPLIQRLRKLAPGVTIEIRILRDTLPEAELASGEIDLVLGFDEYMQVPGYLGKETWLTEPWRAGTRHPGAGEERITLEQLIEMPMCFTRRSAPRRRASTAICRAWAIAAPSRSTAELYVRRAIVSQSDHLLVLPSMVAELLASHWPLKSLPLPTTCRTITSTASGTRSTPSTGVDLVEGADEGSGQPA